MESSEPGSHTPGGVREVTHVAWPIVVGMLSYTAMGVTDTLLVGQVGKTELAAVGLGTTAIFLINSFFLGALHGTRIVSSQATGAGKPWMARAAAWHGMALALVFGLLVVGLAGIDEHIFALMGGPPEVQALARQYFAVRAMSAPFWYITLALCDFYQGTGDTRTPMKINLLANGLNIGLDLLLIFGWGPIPAMGVKGAALGTAIASAIGMVVILRRFLRQHPHRPRLRAYMFRKLLDVGLPIGVHYLLGVSGFAVFTAMLARMGEDELAANQIAFRILSMSFLPGHGIGEAAGVLTGQYIGAGKVPQARRAFHTALMLAVAVMGAMGLLFWAVPEPLIRLFQDDRAVIEIGRELLLVAAVFQIFDAVAMTATGALNGTGDTRFTMMASVLASWLVMVPTAYLLGISLEMGATGAWLGMTFEIIVLAFVLMHRFRSGAWQARAVVRRHGARA